MSTIYYGINEIERIDVTAIAAEKCMIDTTLVIPICDPVRAALFTDPYIGVLKSIFIVSDGIEVIYDHQTEVDIQNFV